MDNIYNIVYRNFPGWFYEKDNTVSKAYEVKEAKKPLIPDVTDVTRKSGTRKSQDSYDKEGSNLRNDIRRYSYNRFGERVAL